MDIGTIAAGALWAAAMIMWLRQGFRRMPKTRAGGYYPPAPPQIVAHKSGLDSADMALNYEFRHMPGNAHYQHQPDMVHDPAYRNLPGNIYNTPDYSSAPSYTPPPPIYTPPPGSTF